ncbi:PLDc_N domain-containing protein [Fibrella sp. HMF5036]|uniref:PLDc_N domain-containing protein n=1 Tax=Fibrella aquatilis TaxID=2817059 RepID=A0A939G624_9BACT|nr:PLDc_N domain-containing protein [Fibrella aquatilis]
MLAIIGLGGQEMLWVLLFALIPVSWFACSMIALINALRSDFRGSSDKLIWVLVILFVPYFGPILYFTIGRQQRVI